LKKFVLSLVIVLVSGVILLILADFEDTEPAAAREPAFGQNATGETLERSIGRESSHASFDSRVDTIEINQSLSYGFNSETGEFFLMDHFAAGKETAIFATFYESVSDVLNDSSTCFINIYRDGVFLTQLDWINQPDDNSLYFQPKNIADVGHWEEGEYRFELHIDDELAAVRITHFYRSIPMKILAVPVVTNYNGRIERPEGLWRTAGQMIPATFPVARSDVEFVLGPEVDLSRYDITTTEGKYRVWRALCTLQTRNNDFEAIIGFIPHPIMSVDMGGVILGYTYQLPAVVASESDPEILATVIHEIAHGYGIGDEYEGGSMNLNVNMPPYGMSGHDIFTRMSVTGNHQEVLGGRDIGLSGTGSIIHPQQRPFHVEGRRMLDNVTSYMGGGTGGDSFDMWVTSDIWIHKFRTFTGIDVAGVDFSVGEAVSDHAQVEVSHSFGQCSNCFVDMTNQLHFYTRCLHCGVFTYVEDINHGAEFACYGCNGQGHIDEASLCIACDSCEGLIWFSDFLEHNNFSVGRHRLAEDERIMAVEIKGTIDGDGIFTAYPWYSFETSASNLVNRRSGEFTVYFFDEDRNQLSRSFFDLDSYLKTILEGGNQYTAQGKTPVDVTVEFPINTAEIIIMRDDVEIYSTDVSQTTPTVNFTGLTDFQQLNDTVTLTWEATGERDLFFEIWYSPAEDIFFNLGTNITGRSFEADLSSLPGTSEGYFYIYATDGVRTGEAASEWIQVAYKAPMIISSQDHIPEYRITEEITFNVEIYDKQEGWLWDNEVQWYLNGKEFMSGSLLWVWPYELPPGTHTFTCVATNSAGLTVSEDFSFTIINDESDIPTDWSREDIVNALSNGFVVPINRIDAPITRGQFATLMTTLYGLVSEEESPYPDYIADVVIDSGQDNYDQFFMVHIGVMDAIDGRFEPNRPITQQEAALIMYRVVALADPYLLDVNDSEEVILEAFGDNNILDEDGPNSYQESENLSKRLALVRLSRLYDAIFE